MGSILAVADAATSAVDTRFGLRPQMPWEARHFAAKGALPHGQMVVVDLYHGIREDFGEGDEEVRRRRQKVAPLGGTMVVPALADSERRKTLTRLDTPSTWPQHA